jgi:hypothetical protein
MVPSLIGQNMSFTMTSIVFELREMKMVNFAWHVESGVVGVVKKVP